MSLLENPVSALAFQERLPSVLQPFLGTKMRAADIAALMNVEPTRTNLVYIGRTLRDRGAKVAWIYACGSQHRGWLLPEVLLTDPPKYMSDAQKVLVDTRFWAMGELISVLDQVPKVGTAADFHAAVLKALHIERTISKEFP